MLLFRLFVRSWGRCSEQTSASSFRTLDALPPPAGFSHVGFTRKLLRGTPVRRDGQGRVLVPQGSLQGLDLNPLRLFRRLCAADPVLPV